ncbi:alcohol dehydrogenase catalytic domain-containing protein [Desulfovibrio sp.]|uniref:zinc-dependent alcohol dehydrogenase n=1 Tax=Desulfovibrio sp. TaxID=885 RepID=UPI0025C4FFEA|nr:alcohol dehydrogenase catalytic domain-containing protein [Desulfovibrio sp.]MCI7569156.1 alcohol dehydrogenase catalytic domain-containing protein [Desulfovibrio sp.]
MKQEMMRAGVLVGPRRIEIRRTPVPPMAPGMLKIRVAACGVCGSDVHMWKAGKGWNPDPPAEFWMGHEFCGEVVDAGDSGFRPGERVTFWANLYCGVCDMCRTGREQLCREVNGVRYTGFVCNGGYAEYFVGRAGNAWRLPETVSDIAAGLIDPLMVAYHAVRRSGLKLHDRVLVVGSGIIAQLVGGLAKRAGASLLAMSRIDDRQTGKAREIGDFDLYLDGNDPRRAARMREASSGGFDVVFEAVGSGEALEACLDGVRPGGEIVLIGNSMTPTIPFALNRAVLHEVRLTGSVSCTRAEFGETIDLIARGTLDVERYVTDILPLEQLQQAFERQTSPTGTVLKTVIRP